MIISIREQEEERNFTPRIRDYRMGSGLVMLSQAPLVVRT